MKRTRTLRRLRIVIAATAALALGAAIIAGLQRASMTQAGATIRLDAPVSFPVDI